MRSLGAKLGANEGGHQATPGHVQRLSVQVNATSGDAGRRRATVGMCLGAGGPRFESGHPDHKCSSGACRRLAGWLSRSSDRHLRLPCGAVGRGDRAGAGMRCWAVDAAAGEPVLGCRGWCRLAVRWFASAGVRGFQPGQDAAGNGWCQGPAAPSGWPAASLNSSRRPAPGEAAGSRRKTSSGESRLVRGTPSPSVVSGVSNSRAPAERQRRAFIQAMGETARLRSTVIEDVDWHEEDGGGDGAGQALTLIVHVRPHKRLAHRCGICGKSGPATTMGRGGAAGGHWT